MSYGTIQIEKMTTESGYSLGAGNASSFKNRIINGGMTISQRNGTSVVTPAANGDYTLDRFSVPFLGGGVFTVQQSTTAPAGFRNSAQLTVTTADSSLGAGDYYGFQQYIEGLNAYDLGFGTADAKSVTLSFWVRSSIAGTYCVWLNGTSGARSYVATYTINSTNTWEYKTITIPGDTTGTWPTDNSAWGRVWFTLGGGSNFTSTAGSWQSGTFFQTSSQTQWISTNGATFYITGVQLEVGTVATSFDFRSYGTELALCQRYYEKSYDSNIPPGTATSAGRVDMPSNTSGATAYYVSTTVQCKVTKRTQSSIRFWDQAGNLSRVTDYSAGGLVRTDNRNSVWGVASGDTSFYLINTQNPASFSSFQWDASAEL